MTTRYHTVPDTSVACAKATLERMKAKHPGAFPSPPRPLKVGIREDLIAAGWTQEEVSAALSHYLATKEYLWSTVAEGAFRIDLKGMPTTPVQPHEVAWAREQIRWPGGRPWI